MKAYSKLEPQFRCGEVRPYYDSLKKKTAGLFFKRTLDIFAALVLLVILIVPMLIIGIAVKCSSKGPVLFRQVRVTTYGKEFKIWKFRTMVDNAESLGSSVTTSGDCRVTGIGKTLRKYRLDELPQLFNVLGGSMSFVGTRPEVPKYVERYENEYYATLLMPAGITSLASIMFKDEDALLESSENADETYINEVLPQKMKYNLEYIRNFSVFGDVKLMIKTVVEVIR